MTIITYPAAQARSERARDFQVAQETYFNALMVRIQKSNELRRTDLDVLEASSFVHYELQALFEAQGYVVTQVGTTPILKFNISWS